MVRSQLSAPFAGDNCALEWAGKVHKYRFTSAVERAFVAAPGKSTDEWRQCNPVAAPGYLNEALCRLSPGFAAKL
jgi:hypothetical protein